MNKAGNVTDSINEATATVESQMTTAMPEETTAVPEQTTAEPEKTTAMPEQTTAEPEQTTSEETTPTPVPEGTTEPPRRIIDPNYREKVLQAHTEERASLNATNMLHLTWDEELEELAWKRALTCEFRHGDYMLPDGTFVGQNLARFPHGSDPVNHVATWIYEKRWFDFNTRTCPNFAYCGHYNQMIWFKTNRLGCAHHFCPSLGGDLMVCNYVDFGNFPESGHPAYNVGGEPCSECNFPEGTACVDNQCYDCGNPKTPKGACRGPCKDNYSGCSNILEDFCKHDMFAEFIEMYCAKFCGTCDW